MELIFYNNFCKSFQLLETLLPDSTPGLYSNNSIQLLLIVHNIMIYVWRHLWLLDVSLLLAGFLSGRVTHFKRGSNPQPPDNHSPDCLTQILTEMWDYRLLLYLFTPLLRGPYFSLDISRATKSL